VADSVGVVSTESGDAPRRQGDVYDDPADTFVATFLRLLPMNLIEDGTVTIGFRPEHFRPADAGEREELKAPFTIEIVECLGADGLLYGTLGGRFAGRAAFSRLPSYRLAPPVGETREFVVDRFIAGFTAGDVK